MIFVYILLCALFITILFFGVFSYIIFSSSLKRKETLSIKLNDDFKNNDKDSLEYLFDKEYQNVFIKAQDETRLHGMYIKSSNKTSNIVIIAHRYRADATSLGLIAKTYIEKDFDVLLIDLRAHGLSGGKYCGMGALEKNDIQEWVKYVNDRFMNKCNIILHGISLGAACCLGSLYKNDNESVKMVFADSTFTKVYDIYVCVGTKRYGKILAAILMIFVGILTRLIAKFSLRKISTMEWIKESKIPIMFIIGSEDKMIDQEKFLVLYDGYKGPKELKVIEGAHHALGHYVDKEEYKRFVNGALAKYFKN
ncbi:MAG: alpha/beta hydrolase [Erysipelotrichales bacterium]|nr:alpha/beta hydrolase [Erysipelotrichales bacterium]